MHIDMAVVTVLLGAILTCIIAFPIWVVKSFKDSSDKTAEKLEKSTKEAADRLNESNKEAATKLDKYNKESAEKIDSANHEVNRRLGVVQMELENSRVKRHELAAKVISLSDMVLRLLNEFEKMRDKMQEHIENSDCRKR